MTDLGSRFAQRTQTTEAPMGPCRCPGTPHPKGDVARVVRQFGQGDAVLIGEAGFTAAAARGGYDAGAAELREVELGLVDWNLLDAESKPVPISHDTIHALDQVSLAYLVAALAPALDRAQGPLPNGDGAASAAGSPASASPGPSTTTQTPDASTTP